MTPDYQVIFFDELREMAQHLSNNPRVMRKRDARELAHIAFTFYPALREVKR